MSWTLYQMAYSPWSEKARWALDWHGHEYRKVEHLPLLTEPLIRLRAGIWGERVSVPFLVADGRGIGDSFAIAQFADAEGLKKPSPAASLFPAGQLEAITGWNRLSEQAISAARAIVTRRIIADRAALKASIPDFFPRLFHAPLIPVAQFSAGYIESKYQTADLRDEAAEGSITGSLEALRTSLAGRPYLLGDFSYADIAMAEALQFVKPVENDRAIPLKPKQRECMTHARLADLFDDLMGWRDELYAKHRFRS
jgi:glutathione S-transferase